MGSRVEAAFEFFKAAGPKLFCGLFLVTVGVLILFGVAANDKMAIEFQKVFFGVAVVFFVAGGWQLVFVSFDFAKSKLEGEKVK